MKSDRLYLEHISECMQRIEIYATNRDDFFSDIKTQDAILRNLHTLSESTQRISSAMRAKFPEVRWADLSAFRNVVVHDYLGLHLDEIWSILQVELPRLKTQVAAMKLSLEDTHPTD